MLRLQRISFVLAATICVANSAQAAVNCSGNDLTTMDQIECNGREHKQTEAALLSAYRAALSSNVERKAAIIETQRSFIALRERDCKLIGDKYPGGSMAGPAIQTCLIAHNRDRTTYLRGLAE